jgi:hypothetical protein
MKFVEHKRELWVFYHHLFDFSVNPSGDSAHVKTIINLIQTLDNICTSTAAADVSNEARF